VNERITRPEWRNVLIWAGALMALTTLPYAACAAAQNDAWTFGGSVLGVRDINTYLGTMRLGARGEWLFHIFATPEPHPGAWFRLPYILLGKVAALFADPSAPAIVSAMVMVFHAARVIFGALLVVMTYRFVAVYLRGSAVRIAATVVITAGGGLGWLLTLLGLADWLGSQPVDFFVPEAYTFLVLYALPHMALARSLMLAGLLLIFADVRRWLPRTLGAGLCWAGMGLCVPFYVAVLYVVLGAWGLGMWARMRRFPSELFRRCVVGAAVAAPVLAYSAYHFTTNEVFAVWSSQNVLPSPHPLHYVFGYGVLAVPAVWGVVWAWRRGDRRERDILLVAWLVAAPLMVYLPINVQRRLAEAVFVPLGIVAVAGLRASLAPWLARRLGWTRRVSWKLALGAVLALTLPTSALLMVGGAAQALRPDWPVFHPAGEVAAMDWLAAHAPRDAVALASFATGNYLPVRADVRVLLGLGPETVRADEKRALVDDFFSGRMSAYERAGLYAEYTIAYVFHGPQEGAVEHPNPAWAADLQPLYQAAGYTVYEVP
jgi:hypothetical protein